MLARHGGTSISRRAGTHISIAARNAYLLRA